MISNKCKYAIRALQYIARQTEEDRAIMSSEIATEEHIPKKFLESILHQLKNNQILSSKRGAHGGYRLLKDPNEITLTEVMRIIDGPIALLPCVSLNYYASCDECNESNCSIKGVFEEVRDRTLEVLNKTSIASMNELRSLERDI